MLYDAQMYCQQQQSFTAPHVAQSCLLPVQSAWLNKGIKGASSGQTCLRIYVFLEETCENVFWVELWTYINVFACFFFFKSFKLPEQMKQQ